MVTKKSKGGGGKATAADVATDGMNDACECRSGPMSGSVLFSAGRFRAKPLYFSRVDGLAMFEGDIVLGDADALEADAAAGGGEILQSVGVTGQQFRWPNGRIPFEIDPALPNQQRVTDAIAHWHLRTGIRFVARAGEANFVRFVPGSGCSSQVGMRGGQQNITLGPGCSTGNAIHEMGHTVGLWHEQSREDRDQFVQIMWANIDPTMQHNFNQHVSDGDDLGAYDFGSLMHYPASAFSINGQDTIVPRQALPPGVVMGQRTGLSAGDVAGVGMMYPGLGGVQKLAIKDLRKDPITDTVKEIRKDPIADTIKEVSKDPIGDVTIKETRKDPISDPTIKEARKDPINDPTIKEARKDPIVDIPITGPQLPPIPGPGPGPLDAQAWLPFVLARGNLSPGSNQDPLQAAASNVTQLQQEVAMAEQQLLTLHAAYEQAVQQYDNLVQLMGGGT